MKAVVSVIQNKHHKNWYISVMKADICYLSDISEFDAQKMIETFKLSLQETVYTNIYK